MLADLAHSRQELLSHQESLEREVEARIRELRTKDEELKRSGQLASVGLIAGTVAHDLNNPLMSLLLNADAVEGAIPEGDPRRRLVEELMIDARRCRQIAGEIRALSRESEMERVPCAVGELLREAVRMVRFKWEPRRIAVACEVPGSIPRCFCAPPQILQVLVNLIDNAIDATPDGGRVRTRARAEEGRLIVEIEDDGPGIPADRRAFIFKPLFTTKSTGTGLGLAISRRIAERHGGTVEFETRTAEDAGAQGTGTRFRVVIPMEKADRNGNGSCDSRRG